MDAARRLLIRVHGFYFDVIKAAAVATVAFRESLALSRFDRAVKSYERETAMTGEWDD